MNYCVYGSAREDIDYKYKIAVSSLCHDLAELGHTLVFGAGGTGVMGAAARGATDGNGEIIGVSPYFMEDFEPIYNKCSVSIKTDTMAERKSKIESISDVFIICPGGIGTLDEFFQIITLRQLNRTDKEIILYNIDGFYDKLIEFMQDCVNFGFITKDIDNLLKICKTKDEIIDIIKGI